MADQNIVFPIKDHTWTVISPVEFEKKMDKTVFHENETRIPRGILPFFEVNEIIPGDVRNIEFLYNGLSYPAKIVVDRQPLPRIDLKWRTEFAMIIHSELPGWAKRFQTEKNPQNPPILRLRKIDINHYAVNFISEKCSNEHNEDEYVPQKEGAVIYFCSKYYERDEKNRRQAIAIHGARCSCCGFDFKAIYGEYGTGFIEVHHIKPLGTFKEERIVDPKTELFPLCSNCHRMIHIRRNYVLTIEELRNMINKKYLDLLSRVV